MFITEFKRTKSYWEFEVDKELPEAGILQCEEGQIRFKRIPDGLAVYDSSLINSGFVYPGSPYDIFVPATINGIPVVELHQNISLSPKLPFTIENRYLKRVYLNITKENFKNRISESVDPFVELFLSRLCGQEEENQSNEAITVKFDSCGNRNEVFELCSISCTNTLILYLPKTKELDVKAPKIEIRGNGTSEIEKISFTGKVFPFLEPDWGVDIPNNRCFRELNKLRFIEGSLAGRDGWDFSGCVSLERIHLSNGIKKIPTGAFSDCSSLKDLYIPDTVIEIGAFAFQNCTSLESIHLPSNLTKISEGTFKNCKSLKKVFLPDTIEVIENHAFEGCVSMRKPWIPKSIKHIADNAFPFIEWYEGYCSNEIEKLKKVYNFSHFLSGHDNDYEQALMEIRNGRKLTHWMWYIFPQLKGLGRSLTSEYYGINDLAEACAYLEHPVLGKHLIEISTALLLLESDNVTTIMGRPDDMKLKSSMTLFNIADSSIDVFQQVLNKYFDGKPDYRTLKMLGQ